MVVKLALKRKTENIQIWSRYSLFKNTGCGLPASSSAALTGGNFDVTNIWNCGKTGFSNVVKPGTKGVRQIRSATSGERGKNVTALYCMSAAGNFIPPLFLLRWLQHFVAVTNCSRTQPLVATSPHSRWSQKALQDTDFAHDYGLTLISLPPHASRRMQPLDRRGATARL